MVAEVTKVVVVVGAKCSMFVVVAEAVEALVVMGSWGSMMMVAEVAKVVVVVADTRKSTHSVDHQYHHLSVYTKPTTLSPQ